MDSEINIYKCDKCGKPVEYETCRLCIKCWKEKNYHLKYKTYSERKRANQGFI